MKQTLILGAADAIASECPAATDRKLTRDVRIGRYFRFVTEKLSHYLGTDIDTLGAQLTDVISYGPSVYTINKYHDTLHKADSLGISGVHCHYIDQGGASTAAALIQAQLIIQQNPRAVILIAGADIPRSGFSGKADYALLNQGVTHPVYETPYGGNLISFYALLAKKQMAEQGLTPDSMATIIKHYREKAVTNPRAYYYEKPVKEKQLTKMMSDPYGPAHIAVATDHSVACLVCGEDVLDEIKEIVTPPADPAFVGLGAVNHHAGYFMLKGDFKSPSAKTAAEVFHYNGLSPSDIDYAWVYDCFVGMLIEQAANYFDITQNEAKETLAEGYIKSGGKKIPINLGGGLLNYQAAIMLSGATGLIDVLTQYDLAANPLGAKLDETPMYSFLGGNGGIDAINAAVVLSNKPFPSKASAPAPKFKLELNQPQAQAGDETTLAYSTTVHFNTGGDIKPPYVLAISRHSNGHYSLSNVLDSEGNLLKTDNDLSPGQKLRFIDHDGLPQTVIVD